MAAWVPEPRAEVDGCLDRADLGRVQILLALPAHLAQRAIPTLPAQHALLAVLKVVQGSPAAASLAAGDSVQADPRLYLPADLSIATQQPAVEGWRLHRTRQAHE
jgi:hypothetical protein